MWSVREVLLDKYVCECVHVCTLVVTHCLLPASLPLLLFRLLLDTRWQSLIQSKALEPTQNVISYLCQSGEVGSIDI